MLMLSTLEKAVFLEGFSCLQCLFINGSYIVDQVLSAFLDIGTGKKVKSISLARGGGGVGVDT